MEGARASALKHCTHVRPPSLDKQNRNVQPKRAKSASLPSDHYDLQLCISAEDDIPAKHLDLLLKEGKVCSSGGIMIRQRRKAR